LDCKLKIIKVDSYKDSFENNYRIAVVDFSRSDSYPSNFVCMLPVKIAKGKKTNIFEQVFGEDSLLKAKLLLNESLKHESDLAVKAEISRRLDLLEPKLTGQVKCSGCGKQFKPKGVRRFKRHFCSECLRKRFKSN
jgi:hypothetical protein